MKTAALPILALVALASPAAAQPWPICDRGQPKAACVIDGDSLWYRGHKIRLFKTDAPEISRPRCAAEYPAGIRARDRLAELLGLGADVHPTGKQDRYRRDLATIETPIGDVETIMLGEGLTLPYRPGREAWTARRNHWCGEK